MHRRNEMAKRELYNQMKNRNSRERREYNSGERRPDNRKRIKARKRKYGLYALVVVCLALYSIYLIFSNLFYTQKIHVEGNSYSSATDIAQYILQAKTDNSVGLWLYYNFMGPELPIYLEDVAVKVVNPWTVTVQVEEKELVGGFVVGNQYAYCDKSGTVQVIQEQPIKNIHLVQGIITEELQKYDKIPDEKSEIFFQILDVQTLLDENKIAYDRIVKDRVNGVNVIIGDITVKLGDQIYSQKINQIPPIIAQLEGQSGILHLENFLDIKTYISFEPSR